MFDGAKYFPLFDFDTIRDIGDNLAGNTTHTIYSFQPTYTRLVGNHSIRAGYDLRCTTSSPRTSNGRPASTPTPAGSAFTRAQDNSAAQNFQDVATLPARVPDRRLDRSQRHPRERQWYHGIFVQDDWKVIEQADAESRPALRLRRGDDRDREPQRPRLRSERHAVDHQRGRSRTMRPARSRRFPRRAWKARGGVEFASDDARGFWNADKNNIQPRVGFAYKWNDKTVVRGGLGHLHGAVRHLERHQPDGLLAVDAVHRDAGRGLTFQSTLNNPYPLGILQPAGNTLGPNTFLGQSLDRFAPLDVPATAQLIALPGQRAARAAGTVAARSRLRRQPRLQPDDGRGAEQRAGAVPLDEPGRAIRRRSTSSARSVPNPFAGLLPTGFTGANVARSQLLRPFPQFSNVPTNGFERHQPVRLGAGPDREALQPRATRSSATYTAVALHRAGVPAECDRRGLREAAVAQRRAAPRHVEHPLRAAVRPGHGSGAATPAALAQRVHRRLERQRHRPVPERPPARLRRPQHLLQRRSRRAEGEVHATTATYPVFDISGFYFHDAAVQTNGVDDPVKQRADQRIRLASNIRYFPSRVDGIRSPFLKLWDISIVKQVPIGGRVRAQFNVEFLNAFNMVVFNDAEHRSDQRQLRQGDEPEQPAARHPARVQDRLVRPRITRMTRRR